jgi:hypothetical protein
MISARTKAVLAAAKRRGVKLGRDPWGSIDGQGTSNWVGNGCAAGNGRRPGGPPVAIERLPLNLSEIFFSQCVVFLVVVFVTDALHSGDNVANTLLGVVAYSDSDAGTTLAPYGFHSVNVFRRDRAGARRKI